MTGICSLCWKFEQRGQAEKNLGIFHLDCSTLCSTEHEEVGLVIEEADYFNKKHSKSTTCHAPFYCAAKCMFTELHKVYTELFLYSSLFTVPKVIEMAGQTSS